jgi:hypothetical protein
MGGALALTIRLEDGTQYRMNQWTNSMPGILHASDFLDGTPQGIDGAVSHWLEMKADWEAHRGDKAYEHPMTPAYGPYPYGLKPSEYGLVVVDFVSKTILSLQGYSNLERAMLVRQVYGVHANESSPHKVEELAELVDAGRIKEYRLCINRQDALEPFRALGCRIEDTRSRNAWYVIAPGDIDLVRLTQACDQARSILPENPHREEIAKLTKALSEGSCDPKEAEQARTLLDIMESSHVAAHNPFLSGHAIIDFHPFSFEEFPETSQGYAALLGRILELGFELDAKERASWNKHLPRVRKKKSK